MPDDMDPNYDTPYPHQPYNGNPYVHPGEEMLLRIIGQWPLAASLPRARESHPRSGS
jgi:hypothetical protein